MMAAAAEYAAMGWPVCAGAYPPGRSRHGEALRACSCDRVGCPDPGAHPMSPAWQAQATADPRLVAQCWMARPEGNIILVTGRVFDVLDVPAAAGAAALALMDRSAVRLRWHCRSSYVLAPPSRDGNALKAHWVRPPDGRPLPDGLRLLGFLADACEEAAR